MSRELSAARPIHHHVEFDLAKIFARMAGGSHARDHSAGFGAMPNQLDLTIGDQAFSDQHPVELGADGHDVVGRGEALAGFADVSVGRGGNRGVAVGN